MKLLWLTDIHLNLLNSDERLLFYGKISGNEYNAVLITGDIAEAPNIKQLLLEVANFVKKPIYFVLGNHDYYRGTIAEVHNEMRTLTKSSNYLYWLPSCNLIALSQNTLLLGQDGWADGRFGNYYGSRIWLNDSLLIVDLFQQKILGAPQLLAKMRQLADSDAFKLKTQLAHAIKRQPKKIIVLTHVPPFKECCLHEGKLSNDNWLPYFASKATGDVLTNTCSHNPNLEFLVLCGHTHSAANYKPLPNLTIAVGNAQYYKPEIQKIISIT